MSIFEWKMKIELKDGVEILFPHQEENSLKLIRDNV